MKQAACFRKSISTPSPLAGVSRTACLTAALQPVMAVMIKHNSLDPGTQVSCSALQPVMAVMIKHNSLDPGTQISCGVAHRVCLLLLLLLVRFSV